MELDYVKLKDIKPVLSGYIREAQELLKAAPVPGDKTVHDVRVLMKKSRAVMRLISGQVDEETYSRNYEAFRDVGRIMCGWRETSVHRKTLRELRKAHLGVFDMLKDNEKLDILMRKDEVPEESSAEIPQSIKDDLEQIDELLSKAGYRIRFQSLEKLDPRMLINELDNTYHVVVDKYLRCRNSQKPANLHEFRKRAKDFLYQLYFFRPLNPPVIKSLEKKLDAMTQSLGKSNDLAQLLATLEYKSGDPANTPAIDELMLIIREAQDKHLSKVWPVAYKVFCPGQKLVNMLGFRILII